LPITLRRRTMRRKPMCLGAPAIVSGRGGLFVGRRYPSAETRRQRAALYCSIVSGSGSSGVRGRCRSYSRYSTAGLAPA
jgi:hypothetical protein